MNKTKKILSIIQARMGSERFPEKMITSLGPHKIIEWVFKRSIKSKLTNKTILATSTLSRDDKLVHLAKDNKIDSFRGNEKDVLGRYYKSAVAFNGDIIVRICADNPFIDPVEIDRLIKFFKNNKCDYAFNHQSRMESKYADGFGAEIFTFDLLKKINSLAIKSNHREHVTLFLWEENHNFIMKPVPAPESLSYPDHKYDID